MPVAHFRFQCENFKNQFDGIMFFFNSQRRSVTSSDNRYSLEIQCSVVVNKAYRVVRIFYVNFKVNAEFL